MTVGFVANKMSLDALSGQLAQQITTWTRQAEALQTYLAATPDTDLQAMGYSADDVALLKSAGTDMSNLAKVYTGAQAQATAYDFRTFVGRISGLVV